MTADGVQKRDNGLIYEERGSRISGCLPEFDGIVPYGPVSVGSHAFTDCRAERIVLPESVTYLEEGSFSGCVSVKSVVLPRYLKKLPPFLFKGCRSLEIVEFPFEVESFPPGLFFGCSNLLSIPFRAGVSSLPESVFSGCSRLVSVVIPDTVRSIESDAFGNCTGLNTIVLPAELENIREGAFSGCTHLQHIRIAETNVNYFTAADGCLYQRLPNENRLDGARPVLKVAEVSKLYRENTTMDGVACRDGTEKASDAALLEYLKTTAGYFSEETAAGSGTGELFVFALYDGQGSVISQPLAACSRRIAAFFGLARIYFFGKFPPEKQKFTERIRDLCTSHNIIVSIAACCSARMNSTEKMFVDALAVDMKKNEEFVRMLNEHQNLPTPFKLIVRNS